MDRRRFLAAAALLPAGMALPRRAFADDYPVRPIRAIVPYSPGGSGDIVIRLAAEIMEPKLGQRLVVENMPGAGGNIGAQTVVRAAPDGYTVLVGSTNNFVINQYLFKRMSFDPLTALVPITRLADIPSILYQSPSVPATSFAEMIAYARAHPGKLNYASPGVGTTPHIAFERLKQMAGIDVQHVPYKGGGEAIRGLVADEVQLYLAGLTLGRGYIENRTILMLGVASEKRLAQLPELPTIAEAGLPGYTASNWFALAAPKGTPDAVIARIYDAAAAALADPGIEKRYAELGLIAGGERPEVFAASLVKEAGIWSETISRGHITIE